MIKPLASAAVLAISLATLCIEASAATTFFRVAGPVPTTITGFTTNGFLTFTNTPTNAVFTIQRASALDGSWVGWVQITSSNSSATERIYDPNPPPGMVLIPGGTVVVGNSITNETPPMGEAPQTCYISPFYMDETEVTWDHWQTVYSWATNQGYNLSPGAGKAGSHPVQYLLWEDAAKWCNARSQYEGLDPIYFTDHAQTNLYKTGKLDISNACVNWSGNGYRLPTEAEWEKAARGGLAGQRFPQGEFISQTEVNFRSFEYYYYDLGPRGYNSLGYDGVEPYTTPTATFPANGYGLYDMAGNVREYCWDFHTNPYVTGGDNPRGPDYQTAARTRRGGSWWWGPPFARCAYREVAGFNEGKNDLGFRCARIP